MGKKKKGKENKKQKDPQVKASAIQAEETTAEKPKKLSKKAYEKELSKLQVELVKLQESIKATGMKVVVIFEGRDTAGKGGTIKRITESLNPRVCRVVA